MKKVLFTSSIALCLLLCAGYAIGFGGMHRHGGPGGHGVHGGQMFHPEMMMQFFTENAETIGLTEEQLTSIQNVFDTVQSETAKSQSELETLHGQMKNEMDKARPDRTLVMTLFDDINRLESELKKANFTSHLDIKEILTEEQQQKIRQLHEEKRNSWMKGKGHHYRGRHGDKHDCPFD